MKLFVFLYLSLMAGVSLFLFQDKQLAESMERGSEIYADFCITCHLAKGEGVEGVFPPLANSDYLRNNREKSIIGIKNGQRGPITVNGVAYDNTMMPMGLTDDEVADVMNYISNSWGNKNDKIVTPEEVILLTKK
ncbi:c-type cytochrome [Spongiimicrobium sp. 3-5]|uniref:c-type cytochrome n=1 Tax=Spongiimicrobium sp. 3-5 TaxID=3332596 RepID=UPI0039810AA4